MPPRGEDIRLASRGPSIVIPPLPWRELLEKNRGGRIELAIYVKGEDNAWRRFDTIENDRGGEHRLASRLPPAGTAGQPLPQHGDLSAQPGELRRVARLDQRLLRRRLRELP